MPVKFPKPKVIFVDVDNTLILKSGPNQSLISHLRERKSLGYEIILWSMRGAEHARQAAANAKCENLFSSIVPKPGFIIDDKGWRWTRDTKLIKI